MNFLKYQEFKILAQAAAIENNHMTYRYLSIFGLVVGLESMRALYKHFTDSDARAYFNSQSSSTPFYFQSRKSWDKLVDSKMSDRDCDMLSYESVALFFSFCIVSMYQKYQEDAFAHEHVYNDDRINNKQGDTVENDSSQPIIKSGEAISVSRLDSDDDSATDTLKPTSPQNGLPRIIIRSVVNKTPYDLAFVDVVNDWSFTALAYTQVTLNDAVVENYKNIVFVGNAFDCLNGEAQIEIVKVEASGIFSQDYGAFLNMCVVPGGINDGSNIVSGSIGSLIFKFMMAGSHGGACISSNVLKNNEYQDVEVELTLSSIPNSLDSNVFGISSSYEIVEK